MQMVHLQVSLCLGGAGGVTINLFTFVNFWEMENGGTGRVANPNTGKVPTVLPYHFPPNYFFIHRSIARAFALMACEGIANLDTCDW
jgi:hypothetical protein